MIPLWRYYVYILFVLREGGRVVFYVGGAWRKRNYLRLNDHTATTGSKWAQQFIAEHPDEDVHREVYAYCANQDMVRPLEGRVWDEFKTGGHPVQPERPNTLPESAYRNSRETHERLGWPIRRGLKKALANAAATGWANLKTAREKSRVSQAATEFAQLKAVSIQGRATMKASGYPWMKEASAKGNASIAARRIQDPVWSALIESKRQATRGDPKRDLKGRFV